MSYLKKISFACVLISLFIIVYFAMRLTHLMSLPLFTDEAIYTRWAQIAGADPNWRFISLTDGKQPLFIWLSMTVMRFIHDPLLSGRLVSAGTGFATMVGLFFLGRELFKNKWVGLASALLYLLYPFALVYDRMALYDSLVGTFAIWGLYIEVLLVRKIKPELAFLAGLVIGGGVLTKTNGFFSIYFLPFTLVLFNFKEKMWKTNIIRWVSYALLTTFLVYLYYSILRLSPFFGIIAEKDHTFIYSFHDWLQHPFTFFWGNLNGLTDWFMSYISWVGVMLITLSLFVFRKFWREKALLLFWSFAPFVALALFGKVLYPRYILPMTLTLIPLMSVGIIFLCEKVKKPLPQIVVVIAILSLWIWKDYTILFDFPHASIAKPDLEQYSNDWPAGGGVREMVSYFSAVSKTQDVYVLTQGTFGSLPTLGLEIYLDTDKHIQKRGLWPVSDTIPHDLLEKAKTMPVYVVFNQTDVPPLWPVRLVAKYQKGIGSAYLRIYQVVPTL